MKPSKYIKNTNYATIGEFGSIDMQITIPANINAGTYVENVVTVAYKNPILRTVIRNAQDIGGNWVTLVDREAVVLRKDKQYPTTLTGIVRIGVCLKGENQIAMYYHVGDRDLIGDSTDTVTAHITMFQSPFEA